MPRWVWIWTAMAALAATTPALASPATIGWITIVDGESTLQRGNERFSAVEGMRVRADDMLTTGSAGQLLRIELDDGKAIDLGPATQVALRPRAVDRDTRRNATAHVIEGWVKVATPIDGSSGAAIASSRLDALHVVGTTIVRVERDESWLFVETGALEAVPRQDGKSGARQTLGEGDSFVVQGGGLGSVSWLMNAKLLSQVPRAFIDTLPRRAQRFAGKGDEFERAAPRAAVRVAVKAPS